MLKKLLKHDFKALFKYWWIVAVVTAGLSALSGKCITILESEKEIPAVLDVSAGIALMLTYIGVIVFAVFSTVMIFIRYYKNLFTDEGYLTFTLPVKRSDILNSKLISAAVFEFVTFLVIGLDVLLMFFVAFYKDILKKEFFIGIKEVAAAIWKELGGYIFVYLLEGILIMAAFSVLSILLLYICITIGSIIAKKAKVIASIGIYYGINSAFSFVTMLLFIFGTVALGTKFETLPEGDIKLIIALIALCILLFIVLICGIFYIINYYLLDRKLNLT